MSIEILSRPARRFLAERLDRLQQTLEAFGERVREGIATVMGDSIGEAVREALHAVLRNGRAFRHNCFDAHSNDRFDLDEVAQNEMPCDEPREFWRAPEPIPLPAPAPKEEPPWRWRRMLSAGLQVAGWCLQDRLARRSGQAALGVACVAGVAAAACLVGPVAAGLIALGSVAVWLSGLAGGLRRLAGARKP